MSKQSILILSYKQPSFHQNYLNQVDADIFIHHFEDVMIEFTQEKVDITIGGKRLEEFDKVLLRGVQGHEEVVALVSAVATALKIPVIDSIFASQNWLDRKSVEYVRLQAKGLPIIDSKLISKKMFSELAETFSYPVIVKHTDASQGIGVFKCETAEEVLSHYDEKHPHLLFQSFIENDGDLRVFVIGDKALGAIKRSRTAEGEFRNNVSQGAQTKVFPLTPEMTEIAVKAAVCMKYDIAGVDLMFDDVKKRWVILEVNRAPQFAGFMGTTKMNVPQKILEYVLSV